MVDKKLLDTSEYRFLKDNPHLGANICYLTISGSKAYGTDNENSDTDIRGVAIERPEEIFGFNEFEQVEDRATDTVIYALKKYISLCRSCNPNVIEMLGTREEDILYINDIGRLLRANVELFLTKRAYFTFAGYATMQLRRLENALAHDSYTDNEKERHILKSIEASMLEVRSRYEMEGSGISFFIDHSGDRDEIHLSANIMDIPLRRFITINSDLNNMLRNYAKLNHRNNKKDEAHLRKHAMHLIRLYLTGIDILENRQIITYRKENLGLLRAIRNGDVGYSEVFKMAEAMEQHMKKAYEASALPDKVDNDKVNELLISIYRKYFGMEL